MAQRVISVRIDDTLLAKLHAVADHEKRSANGQVVVLIRDCVRKFEKKHGEIKIPENQKRCRQV